MEHIENVESPEIGAFYLVRTVDVTTRGKVKLFNPEPIPVFSRIHRDGNHGLDEPHYHVDWRFTSEEKLLEQRETFDNLGYFPDIEEKEYFTPVTMNWYNFGEEYYKVWKYQRDFKVPELDFRTLRIAMKDCKMKNLICPHHGANLKSCKPINGVVTCPQHGLKWNIKTGEQVYENMV